mgnify:CR=1 FL=1
MSTLTVQTLQAPTSGANANKVIIPSGHTLDASSGSVNASGGLTTPAGHVIKTSVTQITSGGSTSSTTSVGILSVATYTTTVANSKLNLLCSVQLQVGTYNATNGLGVFGLRHSLDSYATDLMRQSVATYRDESGGNGWIQSGIPFVALHSPSVAAGTSITYRIFARKQGGNAPVYLHDAWGQSSFGNFVIQEIAP